MKILMVCHGNICRSPLAEGILQHKANAAGLNWKVDSAGTSDEHEGDQPHRLSQKVARINGIDISDQCSRPFGKTDMLEYDKIYVMDSYNYINIKHMSKELWNEKKVDLLMNELHPGKNINVPDPWYGEEPGYHEVFKMISDACDAIIEKYSVLNVR
jgi:protein-tyrosine phosphatase